MKKRILKMFLDWLQEEDDGMNIINCYIKIIIFTLMGWFALLFIENQHNKKDQEDV